MDYEQWTQDRQVQRILELVPQQEPFRFIDRLVEIDRTHAVGQYRYPVDSWFYRGHFPAHPITPGVILLETMAQVGIVSLALHKLLCEGKDPSQYLTYFQDAQVEFLQPVYPGEQVTVKAEQILWRRGKIKAKVDLYKDDTLSATGVLAGMGVRSQHAEP